MGGPLRFVVILMIAALCGLSVYVGGRIGAAALRRLAVALEVPGVAGVAHFVGFALGVLAGAGIAYLAVRRFRIGGPRRDGN